MSEQDQQQSRSPLQSDRGVTTIKDSVVQRLVGMAAGEIEGVHMGGGAARAAGGVMESITGSQSQRRGVSVEIGQVEAAIDLSMSIEYGKNILQATNRVRERITQRVEGLTGLRVTELNITINDVIFPDRDQEGGEEGGRRQRQSGPLAEDQTQALSGQETRTGGAESETASSESAAGSSSTRSRERDRERDTGDREEVRVEGTPLGEDETRELNFGREADQRGSRGGEGGTRRDRDRDE
ncbi:MAG: hypothetical protein AVDCRST_MAG37-507 [uncultured Rubrobacteraceae bacterium]|uniref:Alkaline shock protein 23 n=1 Tax=uncultured Rubrobacteraceae bacterium TaxID=349277 RepID=A0A6J4Q3N7_9ACTN|nr:MAG: hypothetical protein AVDCRST_MAG37-507 [uncultured Rubrobacteraceae bacterium]